MIIIGADKHGFKVIRVVEAWLKQNKYSYENVGVSKAGEDIKLERLVPIMVEKMRLSKDSRGIISCGTGVGVEVGINKFRGIRGVLADDPEVAKWSRIYDKCNVLCLIGWRSEKKKVEKILKEWFGAEYDGDSDRLKMFKEFDRWR